MPTLPAAMPSELRHCCEHAALRSATQRGIQEPVRLRRHRSADDVIDLTDGADSWWARADDLVTTAPSFQRARPAPEAEPASPYRSEWAPEAVYAWTRTGPHDPLEEIEPHAILGLPQGASWDRIERARRDLAKAFHPDLARGASPVEIDLREQRMRKVNAAYDTIKDARQRKA